MAFYTGHAQSNTIYYIESGSAELRWEATLPVPLTSVLSTLQRMPSNPRPSSPDDSTTSVAKKRFLDKADSLAFTVPRVDNLAQAGRYNSSGSTGSSAMDRSETLTMTVQQATQRAEALMLNATGGSLDNLLISERGAAQFVGALSMLDPDFFADRWRASAVAVTELVAIRMTREGLDLFLTQNPLAQVHLRSSMARGRAEITKLEALERIADAHRRTRQQQRAKEARKAALKATKKDSSKGKKSWRFADVGKAFGASLAEAAEVLRPPPQSFRYTAEEEDASYRRQRRPEDREEGRDEDNGGHLRSGSGKKKDTAGLDVFALVSKLRNGVSDIYWEGLMTGLNPVDEA